MKECLEQETWRWEEMQRTVMSRNEVKNVLQELIKVSTPLDQMP